MDLIQFVSLRSRPPRYPIHAERRLEPDSSRLGSSNLFTGENELTRTVISHTVIRVVLQVSIHMSPYTNFILSSYFPRSKLSTYPLNVEN
jgi:hypothetical protein